MNCCQGRYNLMVLHRSFAMFHSSPLEYCAQYLLLWDAIDGAHMIDRGRVCVQADKASSGHGSICQPSF